MVSLQRQRNASFEHFLQSRLRDTSVTTLTLPWCQSVCIMNYRVSIDTGLITHTNQGRSRLAQTRTCLREADEAPSAGLRSCEC